MPPESSFLDDPREHAETINANHITMCKFANMGEAGYLQVGGELKQIVDGIANR
jgi:hypothetical protein